MLQTYCSEHPNPLSRSRSTFSFRCDQWHIRDALREATLCISEQSFQHWRTERDRVAKLASVVSTAKFLGQLSATAAILHAAFVGPLSKNAE